MYVGFSIGGQALGLYLAATPPGKDYLQLLHDEYFMPLDLFHFWTSELKMVPDWMDRYHCAQEKLEKELSKRAEKRRKKK